MGLYGSPYDYVFHVAIIATSRSRVSLITSFQPPLTGTFEDLVAKRRKINDRVVPILVAVRNWNDVICLSRSEKVAEFAQCVVPGRLKLTRLCQKS